MKTRYLCASIILSFLLVFSISCAKKGNSGVTDTEVTIGITGPLSGPAAAWGAVAQGAKAWADYVNSKGGVNGRKIKVILKDDGYNPARALANLQEMKGKIFAVCPLIGTAIVKTCRDFFPENNVALVCPLGNTAVWYDYPKEKMKNIFVSYADYQDEGKWLANHAINKANAKKLAIFYQNDDYGKYGKKGMEDSIKDNSKKAKMAGAVPYELAERALSAHAQKLKETKADTLFVYATPTHAALILKEMHKIGFKPQIFTPFPLGTPLMFKIAGKLWEGVNPSTSAQNGIVNVDKGTTETLNKIKKFNSKIGKTLEGGFATAGATYMMHLVEGLKRAGKKLTLDSFIKGMESIDNWRPNGIGAPVSYSPGKRHGVNGNRLAKAKNGKIVPVTDFVIHKPRF